MFVYENKTYNVLIVVHDLHDLCPLDKINSHEAKVIAEFSSNQPFHMTGRGGRIGGVNQPFVMATSQSGVATPTIVPRNGE